MLETTPQFLLATQSRSDIEGGWWRFLLQDFKNTETTVAADFESAVLGDRVALLAAVRGLEAIPRPSRVVLLTDSQYVHRGFRHGLRAWQDQGWEWERFGRRVPVRNHDLWLRVAQARRFHQISLRYLDIGLPEFGNQEQWYSSKQFAESIRQAAQQIESPKAEFDPPELLKSA